MHIINYTPTTLNIVTCSPLMYSYWSLCHHLYSQNVYINEAQNNTSFKKHNNITYIIPYTQKNTITQEHFLQMAFSRTTLALVLFAVLVGSTLAQRPFLAPSPAPAFAPKSPSTVASPITASPVEGPTNSFAVDGKGPTSAPAPIDGEVF
ncbi:hypothetical protein RND81_06G133000 [Saponaria officinalis]|uniref:Uncharacterized protein n=1 Tax=Saponaria officinalis TaxID=3572 RepID=A0AAW1K602_SAPOF